LKVGAVPSAPTDPLAESKLKTSSLDELKVNLGTSSVSIGRLLAGEAKVGVGGGSRRELGALATGNVNMKPLLVFLSKASAASVDVKSDFGGCWDLCISGASELPLLL
jgi:hypothetical protein